MEAVDLCTNDGAVNVGRRPPDEKALRSLCSLSRSLMLLGLREPFLTVLS